MTRLKIRISARRHSKLMMQDWHRETTKRCRASLSIRKIWQMSDQWAMRCRIRRRDVTICLRGRWSQSVTREGKIVMKGNHRAGMLRAIRMTMRLMASPRSSSLSATRWISMMSWTHSMMSASMETLRRRTCISIAFSWTWATWMWWAMWRQVASQASDRLQIFTWLARLSSSLMPRTMDRWASTCKIRMRPRVVDRPLLESQLMHRLIK